MFPNPEDDLFSDAMDSAANAFHSTRYGILKNAERTGEITDGERVIRRSLAAAFNAYVREIGPTPETGARLVTLEPEEHRERLSHAEWDEGTP